MLQLKNILKEYITGSTKVIALNDVSLDFRKCEFVSILGPSGCGKTTLLNIIGGLDRYTAGDMLINGISTKKYKDEDWDTYRNHSIGFVFQNYNLITHQSVFDNVELSLTIAGLSVKERKVKVNNALAKVGLSDQTNKKPSQLSGGQMQRVAIARALVNDPEIILADEPTGALDSETSLQVMEILKEIANDRLVIMVTHNSELANNYSNRIIKMLDGKILVDSNPFFYEKTETVKTTEKKTKIKKSSMSFATAFKLSCKNLYNKKGRTTLTAIAGSIGVICIALILAINSGFSIYISNFEKDSLGKYPLVITTSSYSLYDMFEEATDDNKIDVSSIDIDSIMDILQNDDLELEQYSDEEKVFIEKLLSDTFKGETSLVKESDLSYFMDYLENDYDDSLGKIKVDYNLSLDIYQKNATYSSYTQLSPFFDRVYNDMSLFVPDSIDEKSKEELASFINGLDVWSMMVDDNDVISSQYDLLGGTLPDTTTVEGEDISDTAQDIVLVVDEYNQVSDMMLYALGQLSMYQLMGDAMSDTDWGIFFQGATLDGVDFDFDEIIGQEFSLLLPTDDYNYNEETQLYESVLDNKNDLNAAIEEKGITLRISGIVRLKEGVSGGCIDGVIGYTQQLAEYIINTISDSDIVKSQIAEYDTYLSYMEQIEAIQEKMEQEDFTEEDLTMEEVLILSQLDSAGVKNVISGEIMSAADYKLLLGSELGVKDLDDPSSIYIYPTSVENKAKIIQSLNEYNESIYNDETLNNDEIDYTISYTDELDAITSSLSSMVDTITYILIAVALVAVFVTMLLVGIIMWISVQDRTKEIGILRAIGARKIDVSRVFNVETLVLGFVSGILGVFIADILTIPANIIIESKLGIASLLQPTWWHALALIVGSVFITVISGLIPSSMAAKKDPVIALRTD
jgi:putative ABC transport system permease protein